MSVPSEPNPLEFISDDDIVEELARRCDGLVVILKRTLTDDDEQFQLFWRKGVSTAYGLMERAKIRLDYECLKAMKDSEGKKDEDAG